MIRRLRRQGTRYLIGVIGTLAARCAWALPSLADIVSATGSGEGSVDGLTSHLFEPPLTDRSVDLLQALFGSVGNLLQGTGTQLLGEMFAVFNLGIWVMAGIFLTYATFMSIVNTAKDGQFLGRSQMSAWVAVRTVGGIGMLLPKFTGYSFIQVLVMWIVLQGVGLADHIWSMSVNFIHEGGSVYEAADLAEGGEFDVDTRVDNTIKVIHQAAQILKAETCMYALVMSNNKKQKEPKLVHIEPTFTDTSVQFGTKDHPAICGQFSWEVSTALIDNDMNADEKVAFKKKYERYKKAAVSEMVMDLARTAESLLNKQQTVEPSKCLDCSLQKRQDGYSACTRDNIEVGEYCNEAGALVAAASDYESIIRPMRTEAVRKNLSEERFKQHEKAKAEGWILANKYYFEMTKPDSRGGRVDVSSNFLIRNDQGENANIQYNKLGEVSRLLLSSVRDALNEALRWVDYQDTEIMASNEVEKILKENRIPKTYKSQASTIAYIIYHKDPADATNADESGCEGSYANRLRCQIDGINVNIESRKFMGFDVGKKINEDIKSLITTPLYKWARINLGAGESGNLGSRALLSYQDPIRRLRDLGLTMIDAATTFWKDATSHVFNHLLSTALAVQGVLVGMAVGFSYLPGKLGENLMMGFSTGLTMLFQIGMTLTFWYLPLGIALSTPIFMMGITLGVYTPFIPYIIYTFAGIGWLIGVVEAMVAAPLIALGMTHPEGHDLMGKAEQSLMLLLTVFLRPPAVLMGLIIGIVLSFVGLDLIDRGFFQVMVEQINTYSSRNGMTFLIAMGGLLMLYTMTVVAIVNQCFSLIYVLYSRLARWIGGPAEQPMEAQLLQEIRQGFEQRAGAAAQGAGEMVRGQRGAPVQPGGMGVKKEDKKDDSTQINQ